MVNSFVHILPLADFEPHRQGKAVVIETVMVKPRMFTVCPFVESLLRTGAAWDPDSCPGSFSPV